MPALLWLGAFSIQAAKIGTSKKGLTVLKKRMIMYIKKRSGQGLVEYSLIIGLMAIVAIAVLSLMGESVQSYYFDVIINAIRSVVPS